MCCTAVLTLLFTTIPGNVATGDIVSPGDEATNKSTDNACSYSKIGQCAHVGDANMQLTQCKHDGCTETFHHPCQSELAHRLGLKERKGVSEMKLCPNHLGDMYEVSPLVQSDPGFMGHAAQASERASKRTPNLPDRLSAHQDHSSIAQAVEVAASDPSQSKILPKQLVQREPRDLEKEWKESLSLPIAQVSNRFAGLDLSGRPVKVDDQCASEVVEEFHEALSHIDPKYDRTIREASQLGRMPELKKLFDTHVIITPYSLSIRKCGNANCKHCKPIRAPEGTVRELAMQRQPTPKLDKSRPGHFYSREAAIAKFGQKDSSLVDFSDLPTKKGDRPSDAKKTAKKRDTQVGKSVSKWAPTSVRATVTCENCARPRCLFAKSALSEEQGSQLQVLKEARQYLCGSILVEGEHPMVVQRMNLSCSDGVEKEYYNHDKRRFETPVICAHCTSTEGVMLDHELKEKQLCGGYPCLPMCAGLTPLKKSNKSRKDLLAAKAQQQTKKAEEAKSKKRKSNEEESSSEDQPAAKRPCT